MAIAIDPDPIEFVADLATVRAVAKSGHARQLRQRAELSLHDVAFCVGTSPANIARWETGQRRPTRELAIRYIRVLDTLSRVLGDGPLRAGSGC